MPSISRRGSRSSKCESHCCQFKGQLNLNIFKEIKKPKSCITLRYTTSGIREHEGNVEDTSRSRVLSTFLAFLVLSFYTWIAWVLLKKRLYNASAKPLQFILVKVIV